MQPLLPYELSAQGPPIAVADVNGDGLDDVFIGGSAGVPGKLFLLHKDGSFVESVSGQPWAADTTYEDWGAVFFDANGDGRPDLYVASGGYRLVPGSPRLQDRLYINRGGGRFVRDRQALPDMPTSTAAVAAGDFTGDGRVDLFVGGRLTPRAYPSPTRSYLLRNDGDHFTDVTEAVAPELVHPGGMITAAVWIDFDGDGRLDLVTAGEWMPIQFYHNEGARFRNVTASMGLPPLRGWWYSLATGDFNHDGHPDLVAGNLGLNYSYTASAASRFGVYAADFTGNRTVDIVLTQTSAGTEYPFFGLATLGPAIYPLAIRFPSYGAFAEASVPQLFSPMQLQQTVHYEADTFLRVLRVAHPRANLTDQGDHRSRRGRRRQSRSDRGGKSVPGRAEHAASRRRQWAVAEGRRPRSLHTRACSGKRFPRSPRRDPSRADQNARRERRARCESRRLPAGVRHPASVA